MGFRYIVLLDIFIFMVKTSHEGFESIEIKIDLKILRKNGLKLIPVKVMHDAKESNHMFYKTTNLRNVIFETNFV